MAKTNPNGYTDKQIDSCIHRGSKDPQRYRGKGTGCTCSVKNREYLYECALYKTLCATHAPASTEGLRICDSCEDCTPK